MTRSPSRWMPLTRFGPLMSSRAITRVGSRLLTVVLADDCAGRHRALEPPPDERREPRRRQAGARAQRHQVLARERLAGRERAAEVQALARHLSDRRLRWDRALFAVA